MNDDQIVKIGEAVLNQKAKIAKAIHENRMAGVTLSQDEQNLLKKLGDSLVANRIELIELLAEGIVSYQNLPDAKKKLEQWGEEAGSYFYNLGVPLDEALKDAGYYRTYIWKEIQAAAEAADLKAAAVFKLIFVFDQLLDHAVFCFSLTYVEAHQKMLASAKSAFLELSVPVVPLQKGIGVLPLIGSIDTERSLLLMEKTLEQATNLKLSHLLIDVSGVQAVDRAVADQLFKVMEALSLIGVKTIITGIRPEVARTMTALGLNIDSLDVKANLHQALNGLRSLGST